MKRKIEIDKIEYVIIETIESGEVFVQFIPFIWLLANKKAYKPRDMAQYYFPRRLPNQSKTSYFKYLKDAKFICLRPDDTTKWDMGGCRILKIGLETIEEAIENEQLFMDYFSTTDAETTLAKAAESKCVKTKKVKKAPAKKALSSSESDEDPVATKICNYNANFMANYQSLVTLDNNDLSNIETNGNLCTLIGVEDVLFEALDSVNNVVLGNNETNQNLFTVAAEKNILPDQTTHQNLFVSDQFQSSQNVLDDGNNRPNEFQTAIEITNNHDCDGQESREDLEIAGKNSNSSQSNCKCSQKVLNKIEYFSKKVFKELAEIREEIKLNRTLCLDRSNSLQVQQENIDPNHSGEAILTEDEIMTYKAKFKTVLPAKTFEVLLETSQSIVSDKKFKIYLRTNFDKLQGANETKTVRKILKSLCDVRCLNECTWSGTKNKGGTKKKESFASLEAIVNLIIEVIEKKHPGCDAIETVKGVVQQRTKSAGEAVANLNGKSQDLARTTHVNNEQDLLTTVEVNINNEQGSNAGAEPVINNATTIDLGIINNGDVPQINQELLPDAEVNGPQK